MEYGGALLPALSGTQEKAFEFVQARALRSLMGNAVDHAVRLNITVVLDVFGMLKMAERRSVARMRFGLSLAAVATRSEAQTELRTVRRTGQGGAAGWSNRTSTYFTSLAARGRWEEEVAQRTGDTRTTPATRFWQDSLVGEFLRALGWLESLEDEAIEEDDAGAEWAVDAAEEQAGDDALEAMCSGRDVELQRRGRRAHCLVSRAARRGRPTELGGAGTALMLLAFRPTRRWRSRVLLREPGGDAMGAFLALLAGLLRAASLARDNGRGYGDQRRCLCGYGGDSVDVHFLIEMGSVCRFARTARSNWHARVCAV